MNTDDLIALLASHEGPVDRHALAKRLGLRFVDTDKEIEARTGVSIPTIFEIEGEDGFRKRESQVIAETSAKNGLVVATGGGGVLREENRVNMRAGGFVIVNPETMETAYLDNGASQTMAQGAGIETAERMSAAGVTVVLSGYVGPKAFEALKAAGIKVCQDLDGMTVREAVEKYKNGDAPFADAPNK